MVEKINCKNCLDYINGYDGKRMCGTNAGKLAKVSSPKDPPCREKLFRGMINYYEKKCINCDHQINDGGINYCNAVLDLVDGESKTCEAARSNECEVSGKYYVGK